MLSEYIRKKFITLYNTNPLLVRSPGRINLSGNLSGDHQGLVLSAAIDKEIICAISPNYSDTCQVHAYNLRDTESFNVAKFNKSDKQWMNLIHGMVAQYQKRKLEIKGFDCVFGGDIPVGAGLASSSAISCAFAYSFNLLFEHRLSKAEIIDITQSAKKQYEGLDHGIMDSAVSVYGKTNQVIRIDSTNMDLEYINFPFQEYRLILCDSGVRNEGANAAQRILRNECLKVTDSLKMHYKSIQSLRDVSLDQLIKHKAEFDPIVYRQYKFLVEENARVLACCEMLKRDDMTGFGQNMFTSHEDLREAFEMSCREVNFLVKKAQLSGLSIGSKMLSIGLGSTINVVKVENVEAFIKFVGETFSTEYDRQLKTYMLKIENGTSKL